MKNLLHFLLVTYQVCDLVSALMEASLLVFQKAVQPGGLMGLLGTESAGRLVTGALCRPSLGVMSLSWGVSWSCDPWKLRATRSIRNSCGDGGTLESHGGHSGLGKKHAVPVLMKAGEEILAAALPCAAHACMLFGAGGFVHAFLCHSFLCGCEVSQLERAFFQGNHNCADLCLGWLQPSFLWKRANSQ